jgi:hypothetical protein
MTKQEHIDRLCYKYSALATMNAENLSRRIFRAALGKSDPDALAAKLLAIKEGGGVSANAPEDEQIWAAAFIKQLEPRTTTDAAKKPASASAKSDDK